MMCRILFSTKNKQNIVNLSSTPFAPSIVATDKRGYPHNIFLISP